MGSYSASNNADQQARSSLANADSNQKRMSKDGNMRKHIYSNSPRIDYSQRIIPPPPTDSEMAAAGRSYISAFSLSEETSFSMREPPCQSGPTIFAILKVEHSEK